MPKTDPQRMEKRTPREKRAAESGCILPVDEDRMPHLGEMNPDLVCASCNRLAKKQGSPFPIG